MQKKVYILEGLDCANCAAKIEAKLKKLPELEEVSLTFATKSLRFQAEDAEAVFADVEAVVKSIEPDVKLIEKTRRKKRESQPHSHNHGESCGCGHDHGESCEHEHNHEHSHEHGESCGCGHEHGHEHGESCGCGHEHDHKHEDCCGHEHDHEHGDCCDHEHGHEHVHSQETAQGFEHAGEKDSITKHPLFTIGIGAVLFLLGAGMHLAGIDEKMLLPLFLVSYLILGGKVLLSAGKNIRRGQIFDENFLMCIATVGAFFIQEYPEAVGVMLFYRIGEYFEDRATEQSRSQIMEAVDLRPEVVNLVSGDEIKVIDAEDAEEGDILLVRPGDRIPLDGVVVEGESRIDTSPVTGEPVPVMAGEGDEVISGCVNTSGRLKIRVEKVLEESMVTRILDSVENAAANKTNIDKFITKFARVYTPFVIIFALVMAVILPLILPGWNYLAVGGDTGHSSVYMALTFLVISCPCALVLSVPLAFFSGIGAASQKGILFKGGISIEGMKNIKAVIMDKTGTITRGNFEVQKISPVAGRITEEKLLALAAGCEAGSTHPIAVSIVRAAKNAGVKVEQAQTVEEIAGQGIRAGLSAGEVLLGNRKLMENNHIDISECEKDDYGTEVLLACDGRFLGQIMISDTIKEDAADAIRQIKKMGMKTVMLTGDAKESAEKIAEKTGIDEVHARLLPEDKLTALIKTREQHGAVMFVGDGINDAPVLAGADVGAAMGSGADAAIEAADVVFMRSEMKAIPEALSIAAMTGSISRQNVVFALAVKAIVMIISLLGFANMWIAVFADTGVSVLCLLNSIRILKRK